MNTTTERPDPVWVRGICPLCGEQVISNYYYSANNVYLLVWECWSSLQDPATCDYRRVL